MNSLTPEMEALKARLRSTWMAGDYGQLPKYNKAQSQWTEEFISRLLVTPNTKVLDVACGTGNFCISAARRGATVTGVDIAPNLLEQARTRAESEGLEIQFDEGDAEQLPYDDASFDLVVSIFGAMFAPRPEKVATELIRVCRSGGRIAMANWTPEGFTGELFKVTAKHAPPPQGMPSPLLWGDESTVRERLREGISDLKLTRRMFVIEFPFDETETVEFFRTYFGPIKLVFEALDNEKQAELRRDLERLWKKSNRATDGTTNVEAEYLEVIALRS
jgi:ubiquinone/menaquinone biosynthesis C-methylase UbiE